MSNGFDITYTYIVSTKTFTIQLNNNSINLSKISTIACTPLNTFSTLVSRDVHGSFSASNITLSNITFFNVYGTSQINNYLNFHEGHTINLTPSAALDCPLMSWGPDPWARRLAGSPHLTSPLISLREPTGGNSLGRPVARTIRLGTETRDRTKDQGPRTKETTDQGPYTTTTGF